MGKNLRIALKVKGYTIYPYLLKLTDAIRLKRAGYRGVNIRIVQGQRVVFDIECYDINNVRITATSFKDGHITEGWQKDIIDTLNLRIDTIQNAIAGYIDQNNHLDKELIMHSVYGAAYKTFKRKRRRYVIIPVEIDGVVVNSLQLEQKEVNDLLNGVDDSEIEDVDDINAIVISEKSLKEQRDKHAKELAELERMPVEERYRLGKWNRNNIFECLGYMRYGSKLNAAKKEVPLLASAKWHSDFKRFIYFRENGENGMLPSESVKDFNAEWVHSYYRFIIEGFENRLRRAPEPSPFKPNPLYVIQDERERYGKNTFIDNIHKGMKRYIQELYENGLIREDFSKKIDASAFVDGSDYGEKIHFITVAEFLQIYKADLPKGSKLDQTRDAFISLCVMGERKSDYKAEKLVQSIDHFKLATFRQPKTGTLLNNVLLKPMAKLQQKYRGELPPITTDFNDDLRDLIKHLKIKRTIQVPVKKIGEKTQYEPKQLSELISSKFGRSTFYLIGGVLGKSFEELRLMAGHKSINIAMKHYWELAKNYTEQDLQDLLNIYN